jgi:hypothetical protein
MHLTRLWFPSLALTLSLLASTSAQQLGRPFRFTIQVASFPEAEVAASFAARLKQAGMQPILEYANVPGRGRWTRVFVGSFESPYAARRFAEGLVARRLIVEFLIKSADEAVPTSRPSEAVLRLPSPTLNVVETLLDPAPRQTKPRVLERPSLQGSREDVGAAIPAAKPSRDLVSSLPTGRLEEFGSLLAPSPTLIPRPDPVHLACRLVCAGSAGQQGGLWLSGDVEEGLARLRWIVGDDDADLLRLHQDGRVRLEVEKLARAAGAGRVAAAASPLVVANYISANEGLLLLVQLTQGGSRYLLHIAGRAPTAGGPVVIGGSINLDNNFDSRINPYRRNGRKLTRELPPDGYDSLVAINPAARWFNLDSGSIVPVAHITFHELAEAHAKVELGLDYLRQASRDGAHNVAIEREKRLKAQRPRSSVVLTLGSNRVLKSEEEMRQFYAELSGGSGLQR